MNNDKVELRNFADADDMGTALDKGDIDLMTRTMSPEQIQKLSADSDDTVDLVDLPGLEIRYLAFNTDDPSVKDQGRPPGDGADHQPRRTRLQGLRLPGRAAVLAGPRQRHRPLQLVLQQVRRPERRQGQVPAGEGRHHHPGEADAALHHRPLRLGHQEGVRGAAEAAQRQRPVRRRPSRAPPGRRSAPPSRRASTRSTAWAGSRTSPTPTTSSRRSSTRTTSSARPYANSAIRNNLIPESRREADRLSPSGSLTDIQDIVADDVPVLPLWQGKQYVAARRRRHRYGVRAQLLLDPSAVGARPRRERLTSPRARRPRPGRRVRPGIEDAARVPHNRRQGTRT